MYLKRLHGWKLTTAEAKELQLKLAGQVLHEEGTIQPSLVAGLDISVKRDRKTATGAAVVLSYPEMKLVETSVVGGEMEFPYVPGYLSFREAPLMLEALERLKNEPDLVLVDGQGIAHPRRMGLAAHLGLFLNRPTIGCAKSPLCGKFEMPGNEPGDFSEIKDGDETIGAVLRTRKDVKPLYISVGNRITLDEAVRQVINCCRGYRLPEPTRLAHQVAGGSLNKNQKAAYAKSD